MQQAQQQPQVEAPLFGSLFKRKPAIPISKPAIHTPIHEPVSPIHTPIHEPV